MEVASIICWRITLDNTETSVAVSEVPLRCPQPVLKAGNLPQCAVAPMVFGLRSSVWVFGRGI